MFLLFSNLEGVVFLNGNYFLEIHFLFYNETISSSSLKVSLTRNSEGPVQMSRPNIRRSNVPWLKKFCWTPPTLGQDWWTGSISSQHLWSLLSSCRKWVKEENSAAEVTFNIYQSPTNWLTDWLKDWQGRGIIQVRLGFHLTASPLN